MSPHRSTTYAKAVLEYDGAGRAFELLGAIRLPAANELVMIFEDGLVAIVQSDQSFEVSRMFFEVAWIELSDTSRARVVVGDAT